MDPELLVNRILDDESLIKDLEEPESEAVVGWLVKQAERLAAESSSAAQAKKQLDALCGRARGLRSIRDLAEAGKPVVAVIKKAGWHVPASKPPAADGLITWILEQQP